MAGLHARLPASGTKQWVNCPGSLAYVEANAHLKRGSTSYADEGTCAHTLVEICLATDVEPEVYRDRLIEIITDKDGVEGTSILKKGAKMPTSSTRKIFIVDTDMIEAVECMTGYVRRRMEETGGALHLESHTVPLPDRDDTGGTADVTIDAWPEVLEVTDYKHGAGQFVPIDMNEQLLSYLLGKFLETGPAGMDYEILKYTICQPRHQNAPSDGIMSAEITVKELLAWKDWLEDRAEDVDEARKMVGRGSDMDDLHKVGFISVGQDGKHCFFCDLKSMCPAALAKAEELACTDFSVEDTEFDDGPSKIEEMPGPNRLAVLLPWMPFLDKWIKEVTASGERFLLTGGKIEGQKLVRRKSNRKWIEGRETGDEVDGHVVIDLVDEAFIIKELKKDFGLKEADLLTKPKLITGPQAEKLIAKDKRKLFNDRLLFKPEGGLTMVPESDSKPAVEVDPSSDFKGLVD